MKKILEKIVAHVDLPQRWRIINIENFSQTKKMWDFQQNAIENAMKGLYLFYEVDRAEKQKFYERYVRHGLSRMLERKLSLKLSKIKRDTADLVRMYFPVRAGSVDFAQLVNRQAFWMATASGKTLVIVKLIEVLKRLMDCGAIPQKDILFLSPRDDLIAQFRRFVKEFNDSNEIQIRLVSLLDYENVKRNGCLVFQNEIIVYYYRSDLLGDEQKEKILDFRNYDKGGNWYVILDEAHKGDKEESKRQMIYAVLSRNGYLFNFSATFTDPIDVITTIAEYNLAKFVKNGYGKHIFLLQQEVRAFRRKEDFSKTEKEKIILKALLLLVYIRKCAKMIKSIRGDAYHDPLAIILVNTVNLSKSAGIEPDLKVLFEEIRKVGGGKVNAEVLQTVKEELLREFSANPYPLYEEEPISLDPAILNGISTADILEEIYHAETPGEMEIILLPENKEEVAMKLKTSDTPFALIKIGDAQRWVRENLRGFEICEAYENRSIFENLENKGEITLLMGSRAFYEGWDSNRPNLILFINIGVGENSHKFVVQSVGRGVRIEPLKNRRKRLAHLHCANSDENLFGTVGRIALLHAVETLFIFGTNRRVLHEIIESLRAEKELEFSIELDVNKDFEGRPLLVPDYVFAEADDDFFISACGKLAVPEKYFQFLKEYFTGLPAAVIIARHGITPPVLRRIPRSF